VKNVTILIKNDRLVTKIVIKRHIIYLIVTICECEPVDHSTDPEFTYSYKTCVLKAVNLGGDTDTVTAVAGGLAGIYYGADAIPIEWRNQIARLGYIEELCESFYQSLQS
jgi:hypothetical protein